MREKSSIEDVPEKYRAMVNDYIFKIFWQHVDHWVQHVITGINREERRRRLDSCPAAYRPTVEAEAARLWEANRNK